ncbi:MAG: glycosyl hydrolase-related protein, partial [Pseudomonadota bacterium]
TGLVVRLFDSHGTHGALDLDFGAAIENLEETDLLEAEGIAIDSGERVRLRFSPYEIKTLKLQLVRP